MRHQTAQEERPVGDLYLTPRGAVDDLVTMVRPENFKLLWDPCASGAAGWTIGEVLAQAWGLPCALSDLYPRREGIRQVDYLHCPRLQVPGAILEVSNPPYQHLDAWVARWSRAALSGDAAIWLVAYDSLPVAADRAQEQIVALIQPRYRLAFQLTPEDAERAGRDKDEKSKRKLTVKDGLVSQPTTGKSHLWVVWQKTEKPGGTGPRLRQHVFFGETPLELSGEVHAEPVSF